MNLSISIVAYRSDQMLLERTLACLQAAVLHLQQLRGDVTAKLYFIDNEAGSPSLKALGPVLERWTSHEGLTFQSKGKGENLGYGGGHNLCLDGLLSDYHLILNPDVDLAEDYLEQGIGYLEKEQDVVLVSPYVANESGDPLYLCKRYPNVLDLGLRGFMPGFIQKPFAERLARYEMQDLYHAGEQAKDIPVVSGCCMLLRTPAFKAVGGFDESFFLYFEDFDLCKRITRMGRIAYNPEMKIVHHGGFSSGKGLGHIGMFISSARRFFSRHGWRWK